MTNYRRHRVPIAEAAQIRQQRHWRITLALAILTGIAIGLSLRSIREDKAAREKAVEAPEAVFRYADPPESSKRALEAPVQQERARYATFEEAMGLREGSKGIYFTF